MTMTTTIADNDYEDQGDKEKDNKTDIPNDAPSEHLRIQKSEDPKIVHKYCTGDSCYHY